VAIKMLLSGAHVTPLQLARFHTEAQAVALLQHPNIVQIYEVGEHEGLPFLSLEFLHGGSLDQKIRGNPRQPREAADLIETLARAVAYAHAHGVVHRDLKPANVLLTQDGVPKITDFGIAKRLEDVGQTKTGTLLGTPSYMAPEQARGETHAVGPPADVYALGAILYELLTGRPPFQAATTMDTIVKVTHEEVVAPSRLRPGLPVDLETICLKCLQKEPNHRYPSATALADDLGRYLADEPIVARPIGSIERLWRWCRRNPRVAVLSGAVLALLLVVAATSTISYYRITQQQLETLAEYQRAEANARLATENARLQEVARREADARRLEAEKAEKKADEKTTLANKQRTILLDSLNELVTKVEDKLRDKEGMSELRKDVLNTAIAGLQKVEKTIGQSALADRSMGVAMQRMGDIFEQMGQTEETLRLYRQSLVIFERLEKEERDNDWLPWNCAVSFDRLGGVSNDFLGDAVAALDYYQRSLALRKALAAQVKTPAIKPAVRAAALSVSYIKLANLRLELGQPREALAYARMAQAQNEKLLEENKENGQALRFLGMATYLLGQAEARVGEIPAARDTLRRSQEIRDKLLKSDPNSAAAKRDLGAGYEAWGDMEVEQGNGAAAHQAFEQANALYKTVLAKEPDSAEDQWYLAFSYYRLGSAERLLGQEVAARQAFEECLRLRKQLSRTDPRSVQRQTEMTLILAQCGQHVEASKAAADLRKRIGKHAGVLFSVGCCYALCARALESGKQPLSPEDQGLKARYLEDSAAMLEQAIALGYRDRETLSRCLELQALRESPQFAQVMAKLPKG
jgi:serine/threonine-protein kinase